MIVYKFGGTSLGSAARMKQAAAIVLNDQHPVFVVLSAVSGTTNALVQIHAKAAASDAAGAVEKLALLQEHYKEYIADLLKGTAQLNDAAAFVLERFDFLQGIVANKIDSESEKILLAQGEIISTHLFSWYLKSQGIHEQLLPALEFMRIDKSGEPDEYYIKSMLSKEMAQYEESGLYITQGYICRNAFGEVDNLKRGGSDFTATLIGQAIEAKEVQIWTDIDGLHNNDPRVVEKTFPIRHLSYRQAAELAYFGAKILHPTCVRPAEQANIPIRLRNTLDPKADGTLISEQSSKQSITAIAAKDDITAVKITSGRMFNAYGFLKKIFQIFERYETSIDMITTSEVAVSLTIDDDQNLSRIVQDLKLLGEVEIDPNQSSICVVGDFGMDQMGYASRIFDSLRSIPIRMISYGGSRYNVSILVHADDKRKALIALNGGLFEI